MRKSFMAVMAALVGKGSGACFVGCLSLFAWRPQCQPTRCVEPAMPPPLMAVDKETRASDMNALMESYNDYAAKMQDYMNCVSNEAESDSSTTGQSIIHSAQTVIGIAQGK